MKTLVEIRDGARECAEAWEHVDHVGAGLAEGDFNDEFRKAEQKSIEFSATNMDLQERLRLRIGHIGTGVAYRELEMAADEEIRRRIWGLLGHKLS